MTNYPDRNQCFKFGDVVEPVGDINLAKERRFYKFGQTHLADVLRQVATATSLPEAVLVITDGVPVGATQTHDWTQLVEHTAKWIQRGNSFQVLKLQGEFYDEVFSIDRGATIGTYDSKKYGKRPYYCFVFSPGPDIGGKLSGALKADCIDCEMLNITGQIVANCRATVQVPDRVGSGKGTANPIQLNDRDRKNGVWFLRWRKDASKPGQARVLLEAELEHECAAYFISSTGLGHSTCALKVVGKKPLRFEPSDPSAISVFPSGPPKPGSASGKVECLVDVRPTSADWYAYRVDLKSGYGTIQPPAWVSAISVDTDARLEDWSKTMHFDKLVKSILAKERVLATVYLAIGR
jgi:hypothetical protein